MSTPDNQEPRVLVILVGPTASGKSLLVRAFCKKHGYVEVMSTMTRPRRNDEVDGIDAHFVSTEKFESMLANNVFITNTKPYEHYYGYQEEHVENGDILHCTPETMKELVEKLAGKRTIITVELQVPMEILLKRISSARRTEDGWAYIDRLAKDIPRYANVCTRMKVPNKDHADFLQNLNLLLRIFEDAELRDALKERDD
ncbi:MAG: hypothetical protein FWC79_02825 [Oscillospiraceae bacterium]|nr:hypothetical protein [Oscillospiraceae bacterium]